jgi:hypothetical protein
MVLMTILPLSIISGLFILSSVLSLSLYSHVLVGPGDRYKNRAFLKRYALLSFFEWAATVLLPLGGGAAVGRACLRQEQHGVLCDLLPLCSLYRLPLPADLLSDRERGPVPVEDDPFVGLFGLLDSLGRLSGPSACCTNGGQCNGRGWGWKWCGFIFGLDFPFAPPFGLDDGGGGGTEGSRARAEREARGQGGH